MACAVPASVPAADSRSFELADLARLVDVDDPQVSPDGKHIVVVVGRVNEAENRIDSDLELVETATGASRRLTHDRRGLDKPRFSPSGAELAFLASASDPARTVQVFVMPLLGGDTRQVTSAPAGVSDFAWRPDSHTLAFVAEDPRVPRTGAARFDDAFEVGKDGYRVTERPMPSHLWLVSAEGGEARRLTSGSWSVADGEPSWTSDGREVAFCKTASASTGDESTSVVTVVDVTSGSTRSLTGGAGHETSPHFSPRGGMLVYLQPRDGDPASLLEAFVAPAGGAPGAPATRELDRAVRFARWMPDGRGLLIAAHDGTRTRLWEQPLGGVAHPLDIGPIVDIDGLAVTPGGGVAIVGREAMRPAEVYYMADLEAEPRRLTDWNGAVAGKALGRSEGFAWKSDGFKPDGVLTYPPDFAPGRSYPLVLIIHGGPTAASAEGFRALPQLFAAKGFLVLEPNYRGSDNQGNAFQRGIIDGPGEGTGKDVMAGIAALKKRGFVDPQRIAVSGWSFGGFVTTWLIAKNPGFAAAVVGAPALDLFDMWSLSDLGPQRRHAFTGSPWARETFFREQSPLTWAGKIRTPTLILSNAADARVAVTQAYKLHRALEDNGVETKLVVWPTGGHTPVGPARQRDVYRRWIEWIEARLRP
jgi:dipeptidyl aminopeptidase/acylaminoacyl peptidase